LAYFYTTWKTATTYLTKKMATKTTLETVTAMSCEVDSVTSSYSAWTKCITTKCCVAKFVGCSDKLCRGNYALLLTPNNKPVQ